MVTACHLKWFQCAVVSDLHDSSPVSSLLVEMRTQSSTLGTDSLSKQTMLFFVSEIDATELSRLCQIGALTAQELVTCSGLLLSLSRKVHSSFAYCEKSRTKTSGQLQL